MSTPHSKRPAQQGRPGWGRRDRHPQSLDLNRRHTCIQADRRGRPTAAAALRTRCNRQHHVGTAGNSVDPCEPAHRGCTAGAQMNGAVAGSGPRCQCARSWLAEFRPGSPGFSRNRQMQKDLGHSPSGIADRARTTEPCRSCARRTPHTVRDCLFQTVRDCLLQEETAIGRGRRSLLRKHLGASESGVEYRETGRRAPALACAGGNSWQALHAAAVRLRWCATFSKEANGQDSSQLDLGIVSAGISMRCERRGNEALGEAEMP
jgi:hypothetical protein